jgi:hypothetical protein
MTKYNINIIKSLVLVFVTLIPQIVQITYGADDNNKSNNGELFNFDLIIVYYVANNIYSKNIAIPRGGGNGASSLEHKTYYEFRGHHKY